MTRTVTTIANVGKSAFDHKRTNGTTSGTAPTEITKPAMATPG
jgi:hypothetical protein